MSASLGAALQAAPSAEALAVDDLGVAVEARTALGRQLVEERAANQTLRETLSALIARIPAADEDK